MPNECFISYSRRDLAFVDLIVRGLEELGIDPWRDLEDIPGGVPWRQELLVALQAAHNFIYVLSPSALASYWCNVELDHALAMNKRILPIIGDRIIDNTEVRPGIQELNWISFTEDFDQGLRKLVQAIEAPLGFSWGERLDSKISVVSGDRPIKSLFLYRNRYRIGRNPTGNFAECGLISIGDDPAVSRTHATLIRQDNRWYVADGLVEFNAAGNPTSYKLSRNGISVWDAKVEHLTFRPLRHRDYVRLSVTTSLLYEELAPERIQPRTDDRDTAADCILEE